MCTGGGGDGGNPFPDKAQRNAAKAKLKGWKLGRQQNREKRQYKRKDERRRDHAKDRFKKGPYKPVSPGGATLSEDSRGGDQRGGVGTAAGQAKGMPTLDAVTNVLGRDYHLVETGEMYRKIVESGMWAYNAVTLIGLGRAILTKGLSLALGRTATTSVPKVAGGAGQLGRTTFEYVCFAAGTEVHTDAGLKAIEDVEVGDLVWSQDEETGDVALRRVVRTFVTLNEPLLQVVLEAADGDAEDFKVTGGHPFSVRDRGWVRASELKPGDEVRRLGGGWLRVVGVKNLEVRETVYNFEVEGFHTYFVGEIGAWVHNTCWDDIAKHVLERGRFAGQTQSQVAQYLKAFADSATPTTTLNGAKIWRRGTELLIQRPGVGAGGTYFAKDTAKAALRYMQDFIVENGGAAF
jgi:hypothetical protein